MINFYMYCFPVKQVSDVLARNRHVLNFEVEKNANFTIWLHSKVYLDVRLLLHYTVSFIKNIKLQKVVIRVNYVSFFKI